MKKLLIILFLLVFLGAPVSAATLTAPEAPDQVVGLLPEDRDSFGEGLWYVISSSLFALRPDIAEGVRICFSCLAVCMLISILKSFQGNAMVNLCGIVVLSLLLLKPAHALIQLASETITSMSEYGKLLLPVMTAALAAQGGATSSAALYTATAFFSSVLSGIISSVLMPMVYIYLVLVILNRVAVDTMLQKVKQFLKWCVVWGMKIVLYTFTGFISITGVISGTTDQAALKATKLTISGMVPVIGNILSDASETILLSAGVVKNAAGISGLLVILAIAIGPFFRIGLQYLLLKLTGAVCGVFSDKQVSGIVEDFSGAMGMLLAMTGTLCLLLLISVVSFLKGLG